MPRRWWLDLLNPWNLVLLVLWIPVNLLAVPAQVLINGLSGSSKKELIDADTCTISLDRIEFIDRDSVAGGIAATEIVGVAHHRDEVEIRTLGDHYWIESTKSAELFQAIRSMLAQTDRGFPKANAPQGGRNPSGKTNTQLPPKPRPGAKIVIVIVIVIVVIIAFAIAVPYLSHGHSGGISGQASEAGSSSAQAASEPAGELAPNGSNQSPTAEPLSQLDAEVEASQGIAAGILDRWVPQLSAKQQGTEDDGVTYDYSSILRYHASLRARYGEIVIVKSDDYQSFTYPGYWVALVPREFPSGDAVNDWCIAEGWDSDHCFAKRLSHNGGPSENTLNWG